MIIAGLIKDTFQNTVSGVLYSEGITSAKVMFLGDSIAQDMLDKATYFNNKMSGYGVTSTTEDAAFDGLRLNDFWTVTTNTKGSNYTTRVDGNANKGEVTEVVICLGTNDVSQINGAVYTVEQWKTAMTSMINELYTDLPKLRKVFLCPVGRNTTETNAGIKAVYGDLRKAAFELDASLSNLSLCGMYVDLDYVDALHLTTTSGGGVEKQIDRVAAAIAWNGDAYSYPALGITPAGANIGATGIEITLSYDTGSDFTLPATAADALPLFDVDTGTIVRPERKSASVLNLYTGAPYSKGVTPEIVILPDSLQTIGTTDVPFVRDNSSFTLPILPATVTATNTYNGDTINDITNLAYYMNMSHDRVFTSGTNVNTIYSVNGTKFETAGTDMIYSSTAFGNNGGVTGANTLSGMITDDDILDTTGGVLYGFNVELGASSATEFLFAFSNSGGTAIGNAIMYLDSSNNLRYSDPEGGGTDANLGSITRDTSIAVLVNVNAAATQMDVYIDTTDSTFASINPHDDIIAATVKNIMFNTRNSGSFLFSSTQNYFNSVFVKSGEHDAANDPSLADIMAQLKSNGGIT